MIESLLLTSAQVFTYLGDHPLTNASGFYFARGERLFLVTSRHVVHDAPSAHLPDRLEIVVHGDPENIAHSLRFSIPLYRGGRSLWRQGRDGAGGIDVAAIELERDALPANAVYRAFGPGHLDDPALPVDIGSAALIVGFPLGFSDTLHHLPVVRQAVVASSFGLRFQGQGYFLTDARTHRGASGAAVVLRDTVPNPAHGDLAWTLLGIHSSRLDMGSRELDADEALGLNCTWYSDILLTLTD
ncbi:MAG: trypsin-like peptidase domain-containing protein [Gammaproteobacteria bacterium]|nr:trypsin-like peptidase domain-containing protein [Gammaproteobacteria bacterium]